MDVLNSAFLEKHENELALFIKENIYAPFSLGSIDIELIKSDLRSRANISNPEVCKLRRDYFKVVSSDLTDFEEKIIWDGDHLTITGLRFRNLDLSQDYSLKKSAPFIDVLSNRGATKNLLIKEVDTVRELVQGDIGTDVDLQLHAGLVSDMPAATLSSIELKLFSSVGHALELYGRYYGEFSGANPQLAIQVPKRGDDEIEEMFNEKLLFAFEKEGTPIGLIGVREEPFLGQRGMRIIVEHIAQGHRGQALAVQMQGLLKKVLTSDVLLWGEIEPSNLSSVKTAEKLNRKRIGQYSFRELK